MKFLRILQQWREWHCFDVGAELVELGEFGLVGAVHENYAMGIEVRHRAESRIDIGRGHASPRIGRSRRKRLLQSFAQIGVLEGLHTTAWQALLLESGHGLRADSSDPAAGRKSCSREVGRTGEIMKSVDYILIGGLVAGALGSLAAALGYAAAGPLLVLAIVVFAVVGILILVTES